MKRFFLFAMLLGALFTLAAKLAPQGIVLEAVDDSYVVTDASNTPENLPLRDQNFGTQDTTLVSYINKVQKDEQVVSLGLVKFNIASLKGKTIQTATLQMLVVRAELTQPIRLVDVNTAKAEWTEKVVTFNNRPEWSGNAIATSAIYGTGVWYSWDLTPDVTAKVTGDQTETSYVLGLRTVDDKTQEQVLFATRDSATPNVAPRLVVTYQAEEAIPSWYFWIGGIVGAVILSLILGKILFGRRPKVAPTGGESSEAPPPSEPPTSGSGGSGTTRRPRTPRTPQSPPSP